MAGVLRTQLLSCGKTDKMFRQKRGSALSRAASPIMTTKYNRPCHEVVKKILESRESHSVRIENSEKSAECFVGLSLLFCIKTAMTLKSTALVAYPGHTIFRNVSAG